MTPTPQEPVLAPEDFVTSDLREDFTLDGEKIVITGISGIYPESNNVKEFSDILYNKQNPVTSEGLRWNFKHSDLSNYSGKAPGLDRFDAQFFTVHYRLGNNMDPMSRKILEHAYQAIYDAGYSPSQFNGRKVAVYVGTSYSESERGLFDNTGKSGMGIVGVSKTMFANRISYWLNVKGPSLGVDEADCSSISALQEAYLAIKRGNCEAAIVCGANICLMPHASIHHGRITGTFCKDGKTKSFQEDADGYTLSDTLSVLLLQKSKDALRVYAELVHLKTEFTSIVSDDTGPIFGYYRNPRTTAQFIKQFYKEIQVAPQAVEYVEAYGTGVPDADKSELEAIEEVYCENRDNPLLVGSVASNIGLTVAASGMSGITKVLLGYHTGQLAANLHCSSPRRDVAALREGRMRIVTEHERFRRTYVAVNGMSITGVNSHVLLQGHYKPKDLSLYKSSLPRLVTAFGRQESGIENIFENLKSRPVDAEEIALLHNIHSHNISGQMGRGYIILDTDAAGNTVSLCEKCEYFDDARRPLWFVYSGMGSQWAGMGSQLMRIPIFAAAIERCHEVLKPKGLDIENIITSPDKTMFDNILHSFVGIAAIQIGLTDILRELGLKPDGIIGHSVGELGCAYADGCLSAEETILCAYSRGLVSLQTPLIRGSMAAVGLGYKQISKMCPPEIDVACRNGPDSSTISGPADVMRQFVAQLTAQGVFAKEVPCSNIAYHSRYIADAGPTLLKYLKEVITNPKPRSERWLSSSVPQDNWLLDSAKYCSAEYHTNNLLNPVLFEETSRLVPSGAVLVEVAPHGLLQAILKRAMPTDCRNVALTRRGHPDSAFFLLQSIGDLFMHGYTPKVQVLYPKVQFPVSTETPMMSHFVEWIHNEKWEVASFVSSQKISAAACNFVQSIHDDEHKYLRGHVVREKMCYPFAAALVAVWDTIAMYMGKPKRQMSVRFRDVHLYAQPTLHEQRPLKLNVTVQRANGRFEIMNNGSRVASGYIYGNVVEITNTLKIKHPPSTDAMLSSQDIYQLLRDRDYTYSGEFVSIEAASASLDEAALVWHGNWVTLIDGMLQLNALRQPHDGISLPTYIRQINIDVKEHTNNHHYKLNGKTVVKANVIELHDYTRCGGILLLNIKYQNLPSINLGVKKLDLIIPPTQTGEAKEGKEMKNAVTLRCSKIGDLDSLTWVEAVPERSSDIAITVSYAGLSKFDVKKAVGVTPCAYNTYGMDFSGTTKSGERVMGLVECGAASSVVRARPELLWPVPAHWSLEDAATVPLAYMHAFYCLKIKGRMTPGMRVLVHGGTGALGQAAISIALAHQCEVFATVGDVRKKKFLCKLYPQLKDENIGNSRDGSFADLVLSATKSQGCDVVLSCVKGYLKNSSIKCAGDFGIVVDTVQLQDHNNYKFGMYNLTQERSYVLSDFSSIFTQLNYKEMRYLQTMLSEGISRGYVRPLTRVTYAPHDAARAFRLLAASRHRGRVLLRMHGDVPPVIPRIVCNPDQWQLLFWDDGYLGVQLADRLINRGARKLYIQSACITTPYHQFKIESWRKLGAEIILSTEDTIQKQNARTMINDISRRGDIESIYVSITKANEDKNGGDPKIFLNLLDSASRELCPELKHFAVVSTVSGVGQDTCLARSQSGYTVTYLDLSRASAHTYHRDALNAVEVALCQAAPVLVAQPVRVETFELLQHLAALAGINIPKNTSLDTTFKELGVRDENIPMICSFLSVAYNISLREDAIPLMTLKGLYDLAADTTDITLDSTTGLGTFYSHIDTDELLATIDFVVLPTLYIDNSLSINEFDVNTRYLSIVPGMEGSHLRFYTLCERLKLPALVLQPGLDRTRETVRETAERYAHILINKTGIQNNFYLVGYESGVLVALELAAILEDHGLTGTVYLIGCAPDEFEMTLSEELRGLCSEELQTALLHHMYKLLGGEDTTVLNDILRDAASWHLRVDACVQALLGRMSHTAQFARALIDAALASIERAREYVPRVRALRSQLVLLRATTAHAPPAQLALQQYSQRPVAVHQLRTPLSYVANDVECPAIINRYLEQGILDEFEKKNLCEIY